MKSSRTIAVGLCAVLLVGLLAIWRYRAVEPAEPQYRGAQLSRWFARFCLRNRAQMRIYDSMGAMRGLGTNTVAYMVELSDATNTTAFARVELQAQREIGSGDSPVARLERTMLTMIDAEADPRRVLLVDPGRIQDEAYNVLAFLKPDADVLLPLLADRLKHPDAAIREHSVVLLGCIGAHPEKAHPYLISVLADANEDCRAAAADAIAAAGKGAKPLVAPLIAAFNQSTSRSRARIAWALGRMGPDAREALPAMVAMLGSDTSSYHRIMTAGAVYRIDATQRDAFAVLVEGLTLPNFGKVALGELGPMWKIRPNAATDGVPILERVLASDADLARRVVAAGLVSEFEPTHAAAVKVLLEAMNDRGLRKDVAPILAALKPQPVVAATLLLSSLSDDDLIYDRQALDVCLNLGDQRATAVGGLKEALASERFRVRVNAAAILLRFEPEHAGAVALLSEYLKHPEYPGWIVRAADAFSVAGTNAATGTPALTAALATASPVVADAIRYALDRITPPKPDAAGAGR